MFFLSGVEHMGHKSEHLVFKILTNHSVDGFSSEREHSEILTPTVFEFDESSEIPMLSAIHKQSVAYGTHIDNIRCGAFQHFSPERSGQRNTAVVGAPAKSDKGFSHHIFEESFVNKLNILVFTFLIGSAHFFQDRSVGFVQQFGIGNTDTILLV